MQNQIQALIDDGYTYFISGGALGVDQDFAEAVLQAKHTYADIKLEIAVPCRTQDIRWSEQEKLRYHTLLNRADKVVVLSEHYTYSCMQRRNEYMVDKSELVLAYWNGEESGGTYNTVNYAERKQKNLIIYRLK